MVKSLPDLHPASHCEQCVYVLILFGAKKTSYCLKLHITRWHSIMF
jgi:hypothetical protein